MSALARKLALLPVRLDNTEVPATLGDLQYIDFRADAAGGIRLIVDFFQTETRSVQTSVSRGATPSLERSNSPADQALALGCLDEAGLSSFASTRGSIPKNSAARVFRSAF